MTLTSASWILLLFLSFFTSDIFASDVRKFSAALKRSHLRRRGYNFEPSHERHTLFYEDDSSIESAARVHLVPKYPTLVLDDVYDHIKDVICTSTSMVVHFHAPETMDMAVKSWNTDLRFILVSTHTTCASSGSHEPFLVKYLSSNAGSRSITFQATKQTFKEATHQISIDLGSHVVDDIEPRVVRRQASTRQASTTLVPSTVSKNFQTASVPPTVSFQFSAPTESPVGSKGSKDIAFAVKNKSVLPPDATIVELFPGTAPLNSVQLGCKDCSLSGTVTLEAAGFDLNSSQLNQVIDFFDNGFFQFTANKLRAHMEIDVGLLPGFALKTFTANLTRIPLAAIEIPEVITLGPAIELTIPMGIILNTPVNFTTGFELAVPDNSKIIMNVSEISNSSQTGFDRTAFKPLPFNAKVDQLNLNFTAALKPKLVIGAGAGSTSLPMSVKGGVGAFMDFPKLIANVQSVENVNATCDGPAAQGKTNRAVHVSPSATFDMGLHWELGVSVGSVQQSRGGEQVLASRTYSLQSQCLVLDSKSSSLVEAAASSPGSASKSGSGVSVERNMRFGCALLLVLTAITFISL